MNLQHQIDDFDTGLAESDAAMENGVVLSEKRRDFDYKRLLLAVYDVIQGFGTDERPEVHCLHFLLLWTFLSPQPKKKTVFISQKGMSLGL